MLGRICRFKELQPDIGAFPDLKHPDRKRSVSYMISPASMAGKAPINGPHNFHMSMNTLSKGVRPSPHSHPYSEIFIPLDARFTYYWGEKLDESVTLDPFDAISVPAGVFRTFENIDDRDGHMLAIFDYAGDPHVGIVVPQWIFDQFYRDWVPGIEPESDRGVSRPLK
jgi:quercetin dioxygenase-like cupin family protein